MEREWTNSSQELSSHLFHQRNQKEVLDISSTGYGLESVLIEKEEKDGPSKKNDGTTSCGGL